MKNLIYILLYFPFVLVGQNTFEELIYNTSLNDGVIQCYPFNGNANDISDNNLDGELINVELTTNRNGSPNSAYNFDFSHTTFGGQGDEIFIPYDPIMNTQFLTVSVWLKPFQYDWPSNPGSSTIIGRSQYGYSIPNGEHWNITFGENFLRVGISTSTYGVGSSVIHNSSLPLNEWSHVVFSYNQEQLNLYLIKRN